MGLNLDDFKTVYEDEDVDRVMSLLISLGSCFPTEITRHLALTIEQVNLILTKLINEQLIFNFMPDKNYPQPLIACRILDLGQRGYEWFCSRSWYSVNLKGFLWFLERHRGQHKRAKNAYLLQYPELNQRLDSDAQ